MGEVRPVQVAHTCSTYSFRVDREGVESGTSAIGGDRCTNQEKGVMQEFNPRRLSLARKLNAMTMTTLAKRVGVEPRTISAYESGGFPPSAETLAKIVSALGCPKEFYFGPTLDEPHLDSVSFRSLARMTAAQRDKATSQGTIALHLNAYLESRFDLPTSDVPDLSSEHSPEAAAETLRRYWGIGELPVRNVVHLLESKGVRVFSLAAASEVDAFSHWKGNTPFVFLNTQKSSERSRMDAAHELGHLTLHKQGAPRGKEAESEANAFASAFLMTQSSVKAYTNRFVTLPDLVKLKRIWNVSVAALNYRMHNVGMITEWQYRTLCIQLSNAGYRTQEPDESPRERSQLLTKVFTALYQDGINRAAVAGELGVSQEILEQLMFGLTIAAVEGGGRKALTAAERPRLTRIK